MIRIVLADDHQLVREGMRALLESGEAIEVVGEAGNGREAVELTRQLRPDVLVMDISMPELNGIQALRELRNLDLDTRIVMLSMHGDEILVREAVQFGAKGYLVKGAADTDELLVAIRAAHRGAAYFSPAISDSLSAEPGSGRPADKGRADPGLTSRELEMLHYIAEGRTNNEIGQRMHISVKTVERHRTNLMAKLDAHNLVELIRAAIKHRLIQFED